MATEERMKMGETAKKVSITIAYEFHFPNEAIQPNSSWTEKFPVIWFIEYSWVNFGAARKWRDIW